MTDYYKTESPEFDEKFDWLTGDMGWEDHGGKWCRRIGEGSLFHVVEIFNWVETVGEAEAPDDTYHVSLSEVDTDDEDRAKGALESCSFHFDEDGSIIADGDIIADIKDEDQWRRVVCEAMSGYGASAPLEQWGGDDYKELFAKAVAESNLMIDDEDAYEERMESPCNRLGSTRREYARGDMKSAMMRGLEQGNPSARLMSVMHYGREGTEALEEIFEQTSGEEK